MHPLFQRLRERKLVQWTLAYLAVGWVLYQVLETFGEPWGATDGFLRTLQLVLVSGFFLVLVLAWYHGEQGRQRVSGPELLIIAGLLAIVGIGFRVLLADDSTVEVTATEPPETEAQASVAVIPFVNMSGNPDNEYFSDGITEELLNALAQFPDLRVPGRTSSFAFKGQNFTIREIADTLDVAHILEGSVRREADRVVITAQLVDAVSDSHLWSDTFERELNDIFAIQREIAGAIADQLQLRLSVDQRESLVADATGSPEAHEAYLLGRYFWNQRTEESLRAAIDEFQRAVDLDPMYAEAWSGLADSYLLVDQYTPVREPDFAENIQNGLSAAQDAIRIDPDLGMAHASLAWGLFLTGQWEESDDEFREAIRLSPRYPTAHQWYSFLHGATGRAEEGVLSARRAVELDPVSLIVNDDLGNALEKAGRFEEAVRQYRATIELNRNWETGWWDLSSALLETGAYDEALEARRRGASLRGVDSELEVEALRAIIRYRETGEAQTYLFPPDYVRHPFDVALFYARSGQSEEALTAMESLLREGSLGDFGTLDQSFVRRLLGNDPRYQALREKAGITW